MSKISIIVPVYNAEKYIENCVRSIAEQTYTNIEIILVNDGSSDTSGEKCDQLAQQDSRIKVIHKPNGGVSSARNAGLDVASGSYIAFVDSDDTVKSTWLTDLMLLNEGFEADVISFGLERINNGDIIATETMPSFRAASKEELAPYFCRFYDDIFGSVAVKLYKAEIIKNYNLRFDPTLAINEDAFFEYSFFPHSHKFINCENIYYQYYFYQNSSSNKGRDDMIDVFLRRQPVHDNFVRRMGYENIGIPTGEDMLAIGIFLQYLQATTSDNSFTLNKRTKILRRLYADKNFRKYILKGINSSTPSLPLKLGALSVKLKMPFIVAVPVSLKKTLNR